MPSNNIEPRNRFKLIDYFIHADFLPYPDRLRRVRILIALLITFATFVALAFVVVLSAHLPQRSMLYGSAICAATVAGLCAILSILRLKGNYRFCSNATVLFIFFIINWGIFVSGGPLASPATQLLVVPLLTAYFFGGIRGGQRMVALSFATLVGFILMHVRGTVFLDTIESAQQRTTVQFLVLFLNVSVISGMAFIYEYTASTLKRERNIEHQKYMQLAKTDPLTGLANRRMFATVLAERMAIDGAMQPPRRFVLGFLDLNRFKPINDRYGHAVGDEILQAVSARLRAALRDSDFVGRHGGDEFMLILDLVMDPTAMEALAARVLQPFSQPLPTSVGPLTVGASLGLAMFPLDGTTVDALMNAADAAMYTAKQQNSGWCAYRADLPAAP